MEEHREKQITLVASSKPEESIKKSLRYDQLEIRDFTINADKAIHKLQESANRSDWRRTEVRAYYGMGIYFS